jgi:hypothetical protein
VKIDHHDLQIDVEIEAALRNITTNKAEGLDGVKTEWYKIAQHEPKLSERLRHSFKEIILWGEVPEYFMKGKLVLVSKIDKEEYPHIEDTRPICLLPTVTKIFELSIIDKFNEIMQKPLIFNQAQRGFRKEKSTLYNMRDLLTYSELLKARRLEHPNTPSYLVFFDFKRAYDTVPRDMIIKKLMKLLIQRSLIGVVSSMLRKFKLNYNGTTINTYRGLVQGSWLSPVLFNLFINDLMWEFEPTNQLIGQISINL